MTFREACSNTARKIMDKSRSEPVLLVSGGQYSELMVRSFLSCGVHPHLFYFRILSFETGEWLNEYYYSPFLKQMAFECNCPLSIFDLKLPSTSPAGLVRKFIFDAGKEKLRELNRFGVSPVTEPEEWIHSGASAQNPQKSPVLGDAVIEDFFLEVGEAFVQSESVQLYLRLKETLKMKTFDDFKPYFVDTEFPEIKPRQQLLWHSNEVIHGREHSL